MIAMPICIDTCSGCGSPVFVEASVAGGCECPQRDFRLMLAAEKARNQRGMVPTPSVRTASGPAPLPDLTPEMLMSREALSELAAAQSFVAPTFASQGQDYCEDFLSDVTGGEAPQPVMRGRPPPRAARVRTASALEGIDLEQMWLQGSGIPYEPTGEGAPITASADDFELGGAPDDDFELGGGGDIDFETPYRGSSGGSSGGVPVARFRVDQTVVERQPARTQMQESGRTAGRFPILREQAVAADLRARAERGLPPATIVRPPPREESRGEQISRWQRTAAQEPTPPPRQSAMEKARSMQQQAKRPTVYDRIKNSPFDR